MKGVHLLLQAHEPYRLKRYGMFEIGQHSNYFHHSEQEIVRIAEHMLKPINALLAEHRKKHAEKFTLSLAISGSLLEQLERFAPETLGTFAQLAKSGAVEFIAEPSHTSLAHAFSKDEFSTQISTHKGMIERLFEVTPNVIRNTGLIYDDALAKAAREAGFAGILVEQSERLLQGRSTGYVYRAKDPADMRLLVRNKHLSAHIQQAVQQTGESYTAKKLAKDIQRELAKDGVLTLTATYQQFHNNDSDVDSLALLRDLPEAIFAEQMAFFGATRALMHADPHATLFAEQPASMYDEFQGLRAWTENNLQQRALRTFWDAETRVKATGDEILINDWRRLSSSDHVGFMSLQWCKGGKLPEHAHSHDTPYECFIAFMNAVEDVLVRAEKSAEKTAMHNIA